MHQINLDEIMLIKVINVIYKNINMYISNTYGLKFVGCATSKVGVATKT